MRADQGCYCEKAHRNPLETVLEPPNIDRPKRGPRLTFDWGVGVLVAASQLRNNALECYGT